MAKASRKNRTRKNEKSLYIMIDSKLKKKLKMMAAKGDISLKDLIRQKLEELVK